MRASVATGSFRTHVTIMFHASLPQPLLLGSALAGVASPGTASVDTITSMRIWLPRRQGCWSSGRARAVVGQEAIGVLASPWPVVVAEHRADGVRHPLRVAGIHVEVAHHAPVLVGDRDRCLDRARRDTLRLQSQAVEREAECSLLAWLARTFENAVVMPAAAGRHLAAPLRRPARDRIHERRDADLSCVGQPR